jgi:hypothetical protein
MYYIRTGVGRPIFYYTVLEQVLEGLCFIILEQVLEGLLNFNFMLLWSWRFDLFVAKRVVCVRAAVPVQS